MTRLQRVVGRNVKASRKRLELTQVELAERAGMSGSFIGEVEAGYKYPSASVVERIAEELGMRPYQLFLDEEDWELRDRLEKVTDMYHDLKRRLNVELDEALRRHRK